MSPSLLAGRAGNPLRRLPIVSAGNGSPGFVFFWDGWPSNWEPSPIVLDGIPYNCVEQAMMALKARTFDDRDAFNAIMATKDPREQKKIGRAVRGYDEAVWASTRYKVVLLATKAKYDQNPFYQERLLETGEAMIVEASPYDRIWGIGFSERDALPNRARWGANLLGRAIMDARTMIREGTPS